MTYSFIFDISDDNMKNLYFKFLADDVIKQNDSIKYCSNKKGCKWIIQNESGINKKIKCRCGN